MKKIVLTTLVLFFNINFCFSLDTISTKFLPLKVGNSWVYDYFGSYPIHYRYRAIIDKDTIIGGKRYFHNSGLPIYHSINLSVYSWLRFDSSNGNLIGISSPECSTSVLLVDSLASGINDIAYLCHSPDTLPRKCNSITALTFCNQQITSKDFNAIGLVWSFERNYIKNYGIYHAFYGELVTQSYYLLGSVLDGVLCGDTSLTGINNISWEIPNEFYLYQNYPNPFNPTTKIKFDIPAPSPSERAVVRLIIYDPLGREITTLVNQQLKPGTYEVEWDGSNYPSGIYFYKLQTESYSLTNKMILLK